MKKANLTFFKTHAYNIAYCFMFLLIGALSATSQGNCTLAVNGMTNVSLDNTTSNCQALITMGMVADVSGCPDGSFVIVVNDESGEEIPGAMVTADYIGQILEVVIIDQNSGNSSWGNLIVEDKLAPTIDCAQSSTEVFCYELENFFPTATDNCDSDPEVILVNEVTVVNDCSDSSVPENVLKTVTRTYIAMDESGMTSDECELTFTVVRIDDLDDVDEPASLLLSNETHLECDSIYNKLPNGHPSPVDAVVNGVTLFGTGVPSLDGNSLYPNAYEACNILVTFEDTELPPIGCATKIMRTWSILEWSCSSPQRSYEFIQMIEIVDNEGPSFDPVADLTFSTNGSSCQSSMMLPPVVAVDNCSEELSYTISYGTGTLITTNGGLASLPVGESEVIYTVYDACLNATSDTMIVTVQDDTPPVVICDQFTAVALTSDGCAYVNAFVFDDGSYDECSNVTFSVKRMDNGVPCEENSACTEEDDDAFGEYVRFCCIDQAAPVVVILRVTDASGNYNDCMVNVEVQDKLAPTIVCPNDVTVDCDFAYDEDNLSAFFGDYTVLDNCNNPDVRDVLTTDLNTCNVGTATRTISVGTPGTANYSVCTQTITFTPVDLFNDGVADSEPDTDIEWPDDVSLEGCEDPTGTAYLPGNLPAGAQFPEYTEGACNLVGANYEDLIFPFNNSNGDACFKIIRSWTVIDWCQFDTDSNGATTYPTWTHTQIIKVNDSVGPNDIVFTGETSVCTFDSDCADGAITLGATSSDDCTIALDWAYTIFEDRQGDDKFDDILVVNGIAQSFDGVGANAIDASGTYPIGTYKVLYTFSDKCGNIVSSELFFSIVNCKAPTAYCYDGLAVDLMEDGNGDGTVNMWATDLDAGSSHPCGYTVYVSFDSIVVSATGNVDAGNGILINVNNGMVFDCDDLGDNDVDVWAAIVTPEGNIVQSYCTAGLNVQDNQNICGTTLMRIEGHISTTSSATLQDAEVVLLGSDFNPIMTDESGAYAFPLMTTGGAYSISPKKDDDYTNGVSTLDLVMIQRHILELAVMDDPYKVIASDINNDEEVNASDLLELRKLILGNIIDLPTNDSWRFVDAGFHFEAGVNPLDLNFPESYDIDNLNANMDIDFVAVKVGDVNDNATTNAKDGDDASSRTNNTVTLSTENISYTRGEQVIVPMTISDDMTATGFQFTVATENGLEFAGVNSDVMSINESNVGFANMTEGTVTMSWNNANGVSLDANSTVVEFIFTATQDGNLASDLAITSDAVSAEMYDAELNSFAIEYEVNGRDIDTNEFVLYQNTPNPFSEVTNIAFDLPVANAGTLTVFDMTGKVVTRVQRTFDKGINNITLTRSDLGASGVLYYQLEVGAYNASNKMILVD